MAMAEHDGHVRIKLSLDSSGVGKNTQSIKDTFKRLGHDAKAAVSDVSFSGIEKNAKAASTAVGDVAREISGMTAAQQKVAASYAKKTAEIAKLTEQIRQGEAKANETTQQLQNRQDALKDSLARTQAEAEKLQAEYDKINAKMRSRARYQTEAELIANHETEIRQLDKLNSRMVALDDKARDYQRRIEELQNKIERLNAVKVGETGGTQSGLKSKLEAAQVEADVLKQKLNEIDQTEKNVGRRSGIAANVGKALKKGLQDAGATAKRVFGSIIDYSRNATKRIREHFKPLNKTLHHFGTLFKQAFVFGVVMQTLTKIRKALGEIAAKDELIGKQLKTIKGNLITAFAPLWQAVYPVVVSILNVITAITSALANLSIKIFGDLGDGAKQTAELLNGEADAIKGVSDAAKSAAKELGTFDEINQISTNGGGGGGAGGALASSAGVLTDLSWTFEDIYERMMAINWEQVAARINSALLSIDFAYIGAKLRGGAQYVLNALDELLVGIEWRTLGENVADGFSEVLTGELLPDLAETLGNWFNAKIQLFYGFVSTFNWSGFGTAIGNGITSFFSTTNFSELGITFTGFATGILEAISSACEETNWKLVGSKIEEGLLNINFEAIGDKLSNAVQGILSGIQQLLNTQNWETVGENFAAGFNSLLTGNLPSELSKTLSSLLNSAFSSFNGFTANFNWSGLGSSLNDSLNDFFNNTNWSDLGEGISNFIKGFTETVTTLITEADTEEITKAITELLMSIDWMGILWSVLESAIKTGFTAPFKLAESGYHALAGIFEQAFGNPEEASNAAKLDSFWGIEDIEYMISDMLELNMTVEEFQTLMEREVDFDTSMLRLEITNLANDLNEGKISVDEFRTGMINLGASNAQVDTILSELGYSAGTLSVNLESTSEAMGNISGDMETAADSSKTMAKATGDVADNSASAETAVKDESSALVDMTSDADDAATSQGDLADATISLADATDTGATDMDIALAKNLNSWRAYAATLTAIMGEIKQTQTQFWAGFAPAAEQAARAMTSAFNGAAANIKHAFDGAWQSIIEGLSNGGSNFSAITDGVGRVLKNQLNALIGGLNSVLSNSFKQINNVFSQIRNMTVNGSRPFNSIKSIDVPRIPALAKGAVIPANHEFLAILGDQKHGTNIEAPLDTIVQAMMTALDNSGMHRGATADEIAAAMSRMVVQFDSKQVGRVVAAQIDANRLEDGKFSYNLA